MTIEIVRTRTTRAHLTALGADQFGDLVKAVVDVQRGIMAIGGELHSDEEAALMDDGSAQADLWGINLYPGAGTEDWLEFDSMINVRPSQGNPSRSVEDTALRERIRAMVAGLIGDSVE